MKTWSTLECDTYLPLVYHLVPNAVLSKLVSSLKEAESLTGQQDLDFLQQLLESKELNALVNVHTKVAKIGKDDRLAPLLSSSMQVNICLELLHCECSHINKKYSHSRSRLRYWSSYRLGVTYHRCAKRSFTSCKSHTFRWEDRNESKVLTVEIISLNSVSERFMCSRCHRTKGLLSTFARVTCRSGRRRRDDQNCSVGQEQWTIGELD